MKTILFLSLIQYGYNTDMLFFSKYLTDEYKVVFLSLDSKLPRIINKQIRTIYIAPRKRNILNKLQLILYSLIQTYKIKPDVFFIKYFPGCSLIKMFGHKGKYLLDIRTATIHQESKVRRKKDRFMTFEAKLFHNISVISKGLQERLKLDKHKSFVLPLGAEKLVHIDRKKKTKKPEMNLIYIGVFDHRNIENTILGFERFLIKYQHTVVCKYTIIGFAYKRQYEENIQRIIKERGLQDSIIFVGRKKYTELKPYLEMHNIGVSYVPITEYFQHQPPTKTYEYIRNGLVCIATNTIENRKVIDDSNGILINEGADGFFLGIEKIYKRLNRYDAVKIMDNSKKYGWDNIVKNILKPELQKLI